MRGVTGEQDPRFKERVDEQEDHNVCAAPATPREARGAPAYPSAPDPALPRSKNAALKKSMRFPDLIERVPVLRPRAWGVPMAPVRAWASRRAGELVGGGGDEILESYVEELLHDDASGEGIDGKAFQIAITGFLERNASVLARECWERVLRAAGRLPGGEGCRAGREGGRVGGGVAAAGDCGGGGIPVGQYRPVIPLPGPPPRPPPQPSAWRGTDLRALPPRAPAPAPSAKWDAPPPPTSSGRGGGSRREERGRPDRSRSQSPPRVRDKDRFDDRGRRRRLDDDDDDDRGNRRDRGQSPARRRDDRRDDYRGRNRQYDGGGRRRDRSRSRSPPRHRNDGDRDRGARRGSPSPPRRRWDHREDRGGWDGARAAARSVAAAAAAAAQSGSPGGPDDAVAAHLARVASRAAAASGGPAGNGPVAAARERLRSTSPSPLDPSVSRTPPESRPVSRLAASDRGRGEDGTPAPLLREGERDTKVIPATHGATTEPSAPEAGGARHDSDASDGM